jgi:hypothetical protein
MFRYMILFVLLSVDSGSSICLSQSLRVLVMLPRDVIISVPQIEFK